MIKRIFQKLHLILGLASGLVVFIVSVTGALYAFKDEIEGLTQTYKTVEAQNRDMLLPSEAIAIGEEVHPDISIHGILYQKPTDALAVIYYQAEPLYYGAAYLNPYSGELIKTIDFSRSFFGFIVRGHGTLWLPAMTGYTIVAFSVIIFIILLITGIVLWWPRKNSSSKNFSFSKADKPTIRRLEYHKVVGFYASFFALLIALTGLSWLLKSLDSAMYKAMGGEKEIRWNPPLSIASAQDSLGTFDQPLDVLYDRIKAQNPAIQSIEIHTIHNDSASILVELNRQPSSYRKIDYLHFDQYTLERIPTQNIYDSYDDATKADKIKRSYYDIHTGNILGLPGKILAFLVSVFCASLPITGFILWWNRRKLKRAFKKEMEW